MHAPIQPPSVCATVLAGGRGSRMGGVDKGLQDFKGHPLAWHAAQRLKDQSLGTPRLIAINANRNLPAYTDWGYPVWCDTLEDFPGPLAGFLSALQQALQQSPPCDYLLVVPCDSPLFPLDLLERLAHAMAAANAEIAMVAIPEPDSKGTLVLRAQPVFCLLRTTLHDSLRGYLASGGRKIASWTAQHRTIEVAFDTPADSPGAFANANTLDQLHQLEKT